MGTTITISNNLTFSEKRNDTPIRCFEGNAEPHQPFWKFVDSAQSESGLTELEFDGVISEFSWMGDEITPKLFKDQLYEMGKGGPVMIKLNSPGGDVIAASKIRSILTDYPGPVTARIDGMAASAAVAVVMAANRVKIMDSAYMMIHDPSVVVFLAALDIELLGSLHDELKSIKDGLVPIYAQRTGLSEDKLSRMMSKETWMSAREAVELGFADEVVTAGQKNKKPANVAFVNCLQNFANVPPAVMQAIEDVPLQPQEEPSDPEAVEREHQAQSLRERVDSILDKGEESK